MIRKLLIVIVLLMIPVFAAGEQAGQKSEEYRIPASLGNLYGLLQIPEGEGPVPLLITCHGYGGTYLGALDYASYFVKGGYAVFSLDFCGGGLLTRSDGTMMQMSVLTEARDLNAVIDYFKDDPRFSGIYLRGESQGGFVASYVAAERPEEVKGVILEYPAYVLQDFGRQQQLPDGSFPEVTTLLWMSVGRGYCEDVTSFDIYEHMSAYGRPVLILHGDKDPLVALDYSERALKAFSGAELIVMPGQGHGFRGAGREEAKEKELAFMNRCEGK